MAVLMGALADGGAAFTSDKGILRVAHRLPKLAAPSAGLSPIHNGCADAAALTIMMGFLVHFHRPFLSSHRLEHF